MPARHPLFVPLVWNAEAEKLLGAQSDRSLAKQLNLHPTTVRAKRESLGIPVFSPPHVWTAAEDELLGKVSDREICDRLKISPRTVQARRRLLNIAPWRMPKRRHTRRCEVCGREFVIVGGRHDQLRRTCPAPHRITRPGQPSDHQKQLSSAVQKVTGKQPAPARGLIKRPGGMSFIRWRLAECPKNSSSRSSTN